MWGCDAAMDRRMRLMMGARYAGCGARTATPGGMGRRMMGAYGTGDRASMMRSGDSASDGWKVAAIALGAALLVVLAVVALRPRPPAMPSGPSP